MDIVEHTKELIRNRPRSMKMSDLGIRANVSTSWLYAFLKGTGNAHADRVQRVAEFLTGKRLAFVERNHQPVKSDQPIPSETTTH